MFAGVSRFALCVGLAAVLTGCGGGSGTMVLKPLAQEEDRPSYNLQAAFNNGITDTATLAFDVEGAANGVAYRGKGSLEQSMLQTVAEFDTQGGAMRKVTPMKMKLTVEGREVQVDSTAQDFYSRGDFRLLGRLGPALEFTEVTSYNGLPSEAQVGASGTLYTAKRYVDSNRTAVAGTTVATYTLEPDMGSQETALLTLRVTDDRADGLPGTRTTTVWRINRGGIARRVSETTVDAATQSSLKATYL